MLLPQLFALLACTATPVVGEPPTSGDTASDPDDAMLYDPDVLHEVEITLDPSDWDALRVQERTYYDLLGEGCLEEPWESPYTWFEAEVTFDGEEMGTVGARKKGLIGSNSPDRPSLRLDVDHYDEGARFHGLEKLVFNNNNQDPSRLRTCLAHAWFADAGLVAPRCSLAHVTVNGEDLGIYDNTEAIDENLVERVRGASPGAMYEGALSDFRTDWVNSFEPENEVSLGEEPRAVLAALESGDDALLDALDAVIDLDAFFDFWAAESVAGHWDGYNGNTNNFYLYAAPEDGRLEFIASGPDATFDRVEPFGPGAPVWVATVSALGNRLIQHAEGKRRYEQALQGLLDDAWDEGARLDRIDAWKDLLQGVSTREQRQAIGDLRDIVASREGDIEAAIGEPVYPSALRGNPCWVSVGTVLVTFTGTWGSYPGGDLLNGGDVTTDYLIGGVPYPTTADGVSIGWVGDGTALWLTISTVAESTYLAPYVILEPEALVTGVDIPIDGEVAEGLLLYSSPDTGGEWTTAAWLGFGSIRFDTLSLEDGDTVSGTLEVSVLGGEE
ncbi:MAG: CotH kinase family protein [Pseudomonadota bacterium]|nr:CotH kinase family protein [Pseudomonadota bacterium]